MSDNQQSNDDWKWAYGAGAFGGVVGFAILLVLTNDFSWPWASTGHGIAQTASYLLTPVAAAYGIYLLNRRTKAVERTLRHTVEEASFERFKSAAEMLSSEKQTAAIAAIRFLEEIATQKGNRFRNDALNLIANFTILANASSYTTVRNTFREDSEVPTNILKEAFVPSFAAASILKAVWKTGPSPDGRSDLYNAFVHNIRISGGGMNEPIDWFAIDGHITDQFHQVNATIFDGCSFRRFGRISGDWNDIYARRLGFTECNIALFSLALNRSNELPPGRLSFFNCAIRNTDLFVDNTDTSFSHTVFDECVIYGDAMEFDNCTFRATPPHIHTRESAPARIYEFQPGKRLYDVDVDRHRLYDGVDPKGILITP